MLLRSARRGLRHPRPPLLLPALLLARDGLARALARARVRVRALPAHGEAPAVPDPLVAADLDLPLDVLGHLSTQVTFDLVLTVDELTDLADLFLGEVADARRAVQAGPGHDLRGPRRADAVDVAERDVHPLVTGEVDTCDTSHLRAPSSALCLLVTGVRADHPDPAAAAADVGLVA